MSLIQMSNAELLQKIINGSIGGSCACLLTNPLEVVKTRLQLQGELKCKGMYQVHYKGFLQAFRTIWKNDGVLALQNGLMPALVYQAITNGIRLGMFDFFSSHFGDNKNMLQDAAYSASSGLLGGFFGSPFYMIKTYAQVSSRSTIAVGYQREYISLSNTLKNTVSKYGYKGLFKGILPQVLRVTFGSTSQIPVYNSCKRKLRNHFPERTYLTSFLSTIPAGISLTLVMAPFDTMATRIYNQPTDNLGRGQTYSGIFNAFSKVYQTEGFLGFYKGATFVFVRCVPQTMLSLFIWEQMNRWTKSRK